MKRPQDKEQSSSAHPESELVDGAIFFHSTCSWNDLKGAEMPLTSPLAMLHRQLKLWKGRKELLIFPPQSLHALSLLTKLWPQVSFKPIITLTPPSLFFFYPQRTWNFQNEVMALGSFAVWRNLLLLEYGICHKVPSKILRFTFSPDFEASDYPGLLSKRKAWPLLLFCFFEISEHCLDLS